MTRSEAKATLIAAFPGRSVAINIDDRHHPGCDKYPSYERVEYRISVLPGYGGQACSQATASTLEHAVELAMDWIPLMRECPPASVLDEQFA